MIPYLHYSLNEGDKAYYNDGSGLKQVVKIISIPGKLRMMAKIKFTDGHIKFVLGNTLSPVYLKIKKKIINKIRNERSKNKKTESYRNSCD